MTLVAALVVLAGALPGPHLADLYRERRYPEVRGLVEPRLADPADHEAAFFAGMLALDDDRDASRAIPLLERAARLSPRTGLYHTGLGVAFGIRALRSGLLDLIRYGLRVHDELLQGVALDPGSALGRTALGLFYLHAPDVAGGSEARARLQGIELSRIDPHAGGLLLGLVEERQGRLDKAEAHYRRALAVARDRVERSLALVRLGYLLLARARLDEATSCFEQAVRELPLEPNSHDSLADAYLQAGRLEEAVRAFRAALELNPRFESSMAGLGRAYQALRQEEEARTWYERFLGRVGEGSRAEWARGQLARLGAEARR